MENVYDKSVPPIYHPRLMEIDAWTVSRSTCQHRQVRGALYARKRGGNPMLVDAPQQMQIHPSSER